MSVAGLPPHLPSTTGERSAEVHGRLLFFGIVRPYKGLDLLLRALPEGVGLPWRGSSGAGSTGPRR